MHLKQERLDKIKTDIVSNNICANLALTATNLVFGDGNPYADIVFIGEAPGKQEDEQGLPFVGASGKFLSEMLASIHMRREQVYITNIVKFRPPNNRDPEPAEKEVFLPFLLQQLAVIEPKLVVTLGRHSMTCFIPNAKISEIHGQPKRIRISNIEFRISNSENEPLGGDWADAMREPKDAQKTTYMDETHGSAEKRSEVYPQYDNASIAGADKAIRHKGLHAGELGSAQGKTDTLVILPLYHPAAALYNGSMRSVLQEDFGKIPQILELIRKGK